MPARPGPAAGASFSADTLVATPSGEQTIGSLKAGDLVVEAYDPATGQTEAEPVQHVWVNHDHDLVDVRVQSTKGSHAQASETASPTAQDQRAAAGTGHASPSKGKGRRLRATLVAGLLGLAVVGAATGTAQAATPAATATPATQETVHTTANHPWLTADHGWVPAGLLQPGELLITLSGATGTVARVRATPGTVDMYNLTVADDHTYAVGAGQWVVHNNDGCEGPGHWHLKTGEAYGGWSEVSVRYQEQITGEMQGFVYRIETDDGPVDFDGYNAERHALVDAKAKYGQFFKADGSPMPWWRGASAMINEAQRQVGAVPGYRIEWHVMQEGAAIGIRQLLAEASVEGIDVIHTPLLPPVPQP